MKTAEILEMGATMWTPCFSNRVPFGVPLRRVPGEIIMDQHDQLLRHTPLPNLSDSSGDAIACTRTLPERTMPKADGMECGGRPPRPDNWKKMTKLQKKHWRRRSGKTRLG